MAEKTTKEKGIIIYDKNEANYLPNDQKNHKNGTDYGNDDYILEDNITLPIGNSTKKGKKPDCKIYVNCINATKIINLLKNEVILKIKSIINLSNEIIMQYQKVLTKINVHKELMIEIDVLIKSIKEYNKLVYYTINLRYFNFKIYINLKLKSVKQATKKLTKKLEKLPESINKKFDNFADSFQDREYDKKSRKKELSGEENLPTNNIIVDDNIINLVKFYYSTLRKIKKNLEEINSKKILQDIKDVDIKDVDIKDVDKTNAYNTILYKSKLLNDDYIFTGKIIKISTRKNRLKSPYFKLDDQKKYKFKNLCIYNDSNDRNDICGTIETSLDNSKTEKTIQNITIDDNINNIYNKHNYDISVENEKDQRNIKRQLRKPVSYASTVAPLAYNDVSVAYSANKNVPVAPLAYQPQQPQQWAQQWQQQQPQQGQPQQPQQWAQQWQQQQPQQGQPQQWPPQQGRQQGQPQQGQPQQGQPQQGQPQQWPPQQWPPQQWQPQQWQPQQTPIGTIARVARVAGNMIGSYIRG